MPEEDDNEPHIEFTVQYDATLAQTYFNESFSVAESSGARGYDIYEYTENGNISPKFDGSMEQFYQFNNADKSEIFALIYQEKCDNYPGFDGMREFIRDTDIANNPIDALIEFLGESYSVKEAIADEIEPALELELESRFTVINTTGHCQGDFATVIVNTAKYEKRAGCKLEGKALQSLKTDIDNLFWNQPIYARLEIDDEEICLDGMLSNSYRWNPDEIIQNLKDLPRKTLDLIKELIPSEPEYAN